MPRLLPCFFAGSFCPGLYVMDSAEVSSETALPHHSVSRPCQAQALCCLVQDADLYLDVVITCSEARVKGASCCAIELSLESVR